MARFALFLVTMIVILSGCASVPPEFLTAMEKQRDGIQLLKDRHNETVVALTENWYKERLERLSYIKQIEIDKITMKVPSPEGSGDIVVIEKSQLKKIEKQFDEAILLANKIRNALILGYSDHENWEKLTKLHAINLEMARSLIELNEAQRKFYSELTGGNIPYPTDFLNEKTESLLGN